MATCLYPKRRFTAEIGNNVLIQLPTKTSVLYVGISVSNLKRFQKKVYIDRYIFLYFHSMFIFIPIFTELRAALGGRTIAKRRRDEKFAPFQPKSKKSRVN